METNDRKKKLIYWGVGIGLIVLACGFLYCGEAKAADCPCPGTEPTKAEVAKARAAADARRAAEKAGNKPPKHNDPMDGFVIPLSAGYLAGNPMFAAGLGYEFKNGMILSGQIVATRIDGDHYDVPIGFWSKTVPFETPRRDETGFMLSVAIPFGK